MMWTAYKRFWQRYVDFQGKSTRSDYWWVQLVNVLLVVLLIVAVIGFGLVTGDVVQNSDSLFQSDDMSTGGIFGVMTVLLAAMAYNLATFIPSIALGIRRVRDTGLSGWWYLLSPLGAASIYATDLIKSADWLIPVGGVLYLIYFVITLLPTGKFTK